MGECGLRRSYDRTGSGSRTRNARGRGLLGNMAAYQIALERWDEASQTARECLALARRFDGEAVVVRALQHLAAIAALRSGGSSGLEHENAFRERATSVLAYVDARLAAMGETRDDGEQILYERATDALRTALGDRPYGAAYREGTTIDLTTAIESLRSVIS